MMNFCGSDNDIDVDFRVKFECQLDVLGSMVHQDCIATLKAALMASLMSILKGLSCWVTEWPAALARQGDAQWFDL